MATIDLEDLLGRMIQAAADSLGDDWPRVRNTAETELRGLAEQAMDIEAAHAAGEIDQETAELYRELLKNRRETLEALFTGLGKLAAERAINAAIGVLRQAVNTAVGWSVL